AGAMTRYPSTCSLSRNVRRRLRGCSRGTVVMRSATCMLCSSCEGLEASPGPALTLRSFLMNFPNFALGPEDRLFGRRALDGLGKHIHDKELGLDFCRGARRRSRVAGQVDILGSLPEALDAWVFLPEGVIVESGQHPGVHTRTLRQPGGEVFLIQEELDILLGDIGIFGIIGDTEGDG